MKERPILYNGDMVRAVLDGRKTQTRRVNGLDYVNESPDDWEARSPEDWARALASNGCDYGREITEDDIQAKAKQLQNKACFRPKSGGSMIMLSCPYGQPGDRLWVRESMHEDCIGSSSMARYTADNAELRREWWYSRRSMPSIHMPRWASRITLEITGVRVERLNQITKSGAISEGCKKPDLPPELSGVAGDYVADERTSFAILWNRINGPAAWQTNPWVWVVEFRRIEQRPGAGEDGNGH